MDQKSAWTLGSLIEGKYRLCELLATGGQGEVYAAEHIHTGEHVAVKCMSACIGSRTELVERMLHEARVTAALRHPNHVAIRDCNVIDGRVYIVMELLEGRDCRALLAEDGPMAVGRAIYIVAEAACGIAAAHAKGVVHRDLKPENIFVCSDNSVKVLDYGTSKSHHGGRSITQDGLVAGTLAYMPPERLAGEVGDERIDIFALGMILLELVLGRHPLAKGPVSWPTEGKLRKLMKEWQPDALAALREQVPAEIWELFAKATARDAECRLGDMAEFRDCLRDAFEESARAALLWSTETPPETQVGERRTRGSERTFAARVLEKTPVLRPAAQICLVADTPVVTPTQYVLPRQERELAQRSVKAQSSNHPRSSGRARSASVEIRTTRVGRGRRIAMSLGSMAAGLFALVRWSAVVEPAGAAREVPAAIERNVTDVSALAATASGQRSRMDVPLSPPMAAAMAALVADEASTATLLQMVAGVTAPAQVPSLARNPAKPAKRQVRAVDIAHVPSGLDEPQLATPAQAKRRETPKATRKLAENSDSFRLITWE